MNHDKYSIEDRRTASDSIILADDNIDKNLWPYRLMMDRRRFGCEGRNGVLIGLLNDKEHANLICMALNMHSHAMRTIYTLEKDG